MSKNINFDPDFSFEELDDERTFQVFDDESEEDAESEPKMAERKPVEPKEKPKPKMPYNSQVLNYYSELKTLIDACGQTAHYWHMWKGLEEGVPKMQMISGNYRRTISYYKGQYKDWKYKAQSSLAALKVKAAPLFKVGLGIADKDLLNMLTLEIDRRNAYKQYIKTLYKKCKPLSVMDLEKKYQERLLRRAAGKKK